MIIEELLAKYLNTTALEAEGQLAWKEYVARMLKAEEELMQSIDKLEGKLGRTRRALGIMQRLKRELITSLQENISKVDDSIESEESEESKGSEESERSEESEEVNMEKK